MIEYTVTGAVNVSPKISGSGGERGRVMRNAKKLNPKSLYYVDIVEDACLPAVEVVYNARSLVGSSEVDCEGHC